jgi:hypothetical protein
MANWRRLLLRDNIIRMKKIWETLISWLIPETIFIQTSITSMIHTQRRYTSWRSSNQLLISGKMTAAITSLQPITTSRRPTVTSIPIHSLMEGILWSSLRRLRMLMSSLVITTSLMMVTAQMMTRKRTIRLCKMHNRLVLTRTCSPASLQVSVRDLVELASCQLRVNLLWWLLPNSKNNVHRKREILREHHSRLEVNKWLIMTNTSTAVVRSYMSKTQLATTQWALLLSTKPIRISILRLWMVVGMIIRCRLMKMVNSWMVLLRISTLVCFKQEAIATCFKQDDYLL